MCLRNSPVGTSPDVARARLLQEGWRTVMNRPRHILAIDQGTTSTRSIVFDDHGRIVALARRELPQHYPAAGWVEHDAEDIWRDTLATMREAIEQIRACGPRHCRDRHHQPARNGGRVGTEHRPADSSRHRLAGPAHCPGMRAVEAAKARRRSSASAPDSCLIRISRAPRSRGCSIRSPARARARSAASSPSAPSTASCSGA